LRSNKKKKNVPQKKEKDDASTQHEKAASEDVEAKGREG